MPFPPQRGRSVDVNNAHKWQQNIQINYANFNNRVKAVMEQGFEVNDMDSDEETAPEGFEDALQSTTGWISLHESKHIPPLNIKHIHSYFITRRIKKS